MYFFTNNFFYYKSDNLVLNFVLTPHNWRVWNHRLLILFEDEPGKQVKMSLWKVNGWATHRVVTIYLSKMYTYVHISIGIRVHCCNLMHMYATINAVHKILYLNKSHSYCGSVLLFSSLKWLIFLMTEDEKWRLCVRYAGVSTRYGHTCGHFND